MTMHGLVYRQPYFNVRLSECMRNEDYLDYLFFGGLALVMVYLFTRPGARSYATGDEFQGPSILPKKGGAPPKNAPTTKSAPASGGNPNWDCITHRERLQVINNNATVTGTVIPAGDGGPHYAPDGDLVFAFKPDPQYEYMLNAVNKTNKKYGGGLWIEGVCQKQNKAKEPRHQGDCKCGASKFKQPKNGDKLRITGAHCKDVGEEGHNEIHPIYTMETL